MIELLDLPDGVPIVIRNNTLKNQLMMLLYYSQKKRQTENGEWELIMLELLSINMIMLLFALR